MRLRRFNIYWRYLLSYILILLIPVLSLSMLNFRFIRSHYTQNLVQKMQLEVNNCGETMSLMMEQINNNLAIFLTNGRFYTFPSDDNSLAYFYEIRSQLQKSLMTNKYLSEIYFYNAKRGSIQSSIELTRCESFRFENIGFSDQDTFQTAINGIKTPMFLKNQVTNGPRILYAAPFQRNFDAEDAYVSFIFFVLDPMTVESVMTSVLTSHHYEIAIRYNGSVIIEYRTQVETVDGRTISFAGRNGVSVELFIPDTDIKNQVQPLVSATYGLILLTLLLSSALIIVLAHKNYKPVYHLFNNVKDLISSSSGKLNEFEAAESALNSLRIDKNQLQLSNQSLKRERLLLKLLTRHTKYSSSFWEECREGGLVFDRKYYCCCVANVLEPEPSLSNITSNINEMFDIRMYTLDFEDDTIFIICSDYTNVIDEIMRLFSNENSKSLLPKGIGAIVDKPERVSESYYSAKHGRIDKLNRGSNEYPSDDLNVFKNAILSYNEEKMLFSFMNIIENIQASRDFFYASCVYSQLVRTAFEALSEISPRFDIDPKSLYNSALTTVDEIINRLFGLKDSIVAEMPRFTSGMKRQGKNVDDLLSFIQDNFLDLNFTVNNIADTFDVSASNLSHFFKQQTGSTISSYIIRLKIEHAKRLLESSDLNLVAISKAVGYTDVSAFIKIFKKITDTTPGEYRKCQQITGRTN